MIACSMSLCVGSVENNEGTTTILVGMIGSWKVLKKRTSELEPVIASDDQFSEDERISRTKAQPDTPSTDQTEAAQPDSEENQKSVYKKLVEIEARYRAYLQATRIKFKVPDFTFPAEELRGRKEQDVATKLKRITDKYNYALKMNELSAKFGRIQPITTERLRQSQATIRRCA
jgi:hypothetical protein